jgi:hypothetical protein
MAPTDRPPGKPPVMPAEQFADRVKQMVSLRNALNSAECVESSGVKLDEDARVIGWAVLPDRDDSATFDAALADHGATLDARSLDPPVARDGGKLDDPGVTVRFSADE